MTKLRKIILAGLLLATMIVLERFVAINTPIVSITFSFIPTMLSAMLLGPIWTPILCVISDLLGCLIRPFGAYFYGYTITAFIGGLIYGIILNNAYKKNNKQFLWRVILAAVLVSVICSAFLNTLWVYITTKKAITVLLPTRLGKEAILLPLKIVIMWGLHAALAKSGAYKMLYKEAYALEAAQEQTQEEKTTSSKEDLAENQEQKTDEVNDDKV